MKSNFLSPVLTKHFQKKFFASFLFRYRYDSFPLFYRSVLGRLVSGNPISDFCTYSAFEWENLLIKPEVQEYFQFISNEYDKYPCRETCRSSVLTLIGEIKTCENHLKNLKTLSTNNDVELSKLIKAEEEQYRNEIKRNYSKILLQCIPENDYDKSDSATIQISPGVGGVEAKLFTEELFEMYIKYINFRNWNINYVEKFNSDGGGINKGEVNVSGESVFRWLKHEAGIHRVQRIPKTEKAGRMQTSTCKINVIPKIEDNEIILKDSELKIETKLSSGPGGQNVQKSETCVKITHLPTGLSVECQRERYQMVNKMIALMKLKNLLYEEEQKKKALKENKLKKEQASTIMRSDKIRTYNFSQNRVTDHRINHRAQNVKMFMEGTDLLNETILLLDSVHKSESLLKNIAKILKEKNVDEIFNK